MSIQESHFSAHSHEDVGGSNAARTHDGQDAQLQSQEWHPLVSQAGDSRDKDHTYSGKTGGEATDNGESDPEHEFNFRGEEAPHPDNSHHKSRAHHSGGNADPGFGAFDRG
jgi:hypothetical protein